MYDFTFSISIYLSFQKTDFTVIIIAVTSCVTVVCIVLVIAWVLHSSHSKAKYDIYMAKYEGKPDTYQMTNSYCSDINRSRMKDYMLSQWITIFPLKTVFGGSWIIQVLQEFHARYRFLCKNEKPYAIIENNYISA